LQKEDTLFWGSKRSVYIRGSSFQVERPISEKARPCLSAQWARGTYRAHREPKNEGLGGKLNPKPAYTEISQVLWGTTYRRTSSYRSLDKCWNIIQHALGDRKPVQDITHVRRNRGIFRDIIWSFKSQVYPLLFTS